LKFASTIDDYGFAFEDRFQFNSEHVLRTVNQSAPSPLAGLQYVDDHLPPPHVFPGARSKRSRPRLHVSHYLPVDYESDSDEFIKFAGIERRDDSFTFRTDVDIFDEGEGEIEVTSASGQSVVYTAAMADFKMIKEQLLTIATHHINRHRTIEAAKDQHREAVGNVEAKEFHQHEDSDVHDLPFHSDCIDR
jgi:hypothetical protein